MYQAGKDHVNTTIFPPLSFSNFSPSRIYSSLHFKNNKIQSFLIILYGTSSPPIIESISFKINTAAINKDIIVGQFPFRDNDRYLPKLHKISNEVNENRRENLFFLCLPFRDSISFYWEKDLGNYRCAKLVRMED